MKDKEYWHELWIKIHGDCENYHYAAHLGDIRLNLIEIGWRDVEDKPQPLMQFEVYRFLLDTLEWDQDFRVDNQILGVEAAKEFAQNWYAENIYSDHILLQK